MMLVKPIQIFLKTDDHVQSLHTETILLISTLTIFFGIKYFAQKLLKKVSNKQFLTIIQKHEEFKNIQIQGK